MQLELHLSKKRIWGKEEVVESKKTSRNQGSAEEPETRDLTHLGLYLLCWLLYFPGLFSEATTWLVTTLERCIVLWSQEERALSLLVSLRKNPRVGCVTPRWAACLLGCSLGSGRRCEHGSGLGHLLTPGVGTGGRIHWLAGLGWEEVPQRKGCYFPKEKNLAPSRKEHMSITFLELVRRGIFITHYYP